MKIILINPQFEQGNSIISDKRKKAILEIAQPLGLAYIAAVLEENNYQVKIFDCVIEISRSELEEYFKKEKADIIGITVACVSFPSAKKIAMEARKSLPDSIIIAGGPLITALPNVVMSYEYFDVGVIGEGEITFLELVKRIEESDLMHLEDIEGIVYRKDGNTVLTKRRNHIKILDDLPFPARHLLPSLSRYSTFPASSRKSPVATLITTRGCPMECSFCDQAVFGSSYRSRTPDNILEEMELVGKEFGARQIRFYDDNFTWDENRIFDLCSKIKRRNIKIPWFCFASVNSVSKRLLKEMKEAGCWQILFGLESGDERVLKFLKKNITISDNERAVSWAKGAGLSVRADFVIGSPWETKESLQKTLDFAKKLDIDYAHFIKFVPFPGSEIYKLLIEKGIYFDFSKEFSMINHNDIMYVPESLTREEIVSFLVRARKEFYFRFSYILRRIVNIETWIELKAQISGLLALFLNFKIYNCDDEISG